KAEISVNGSGLAVLKGEKRRKQQGRKTGAPQGRTAKEDCYDQTSGQAGMKARTPSCGKPSWVKVQPKAGSAISSASSRSSPAGFTPSCSQVSMASRVELNSAMEKSQ